MAHEITAIDQIAVRETPWHRLGKVVGRGMTSAEAIELAGLGGWDVQLAPLYHETPSGGFGRVPDSKAVIRGDIGLHLGIAGSGYHIVQNEELFEFADALVETGEAWYESAGSLRGNRVIFTSMRLELPVEVEGIEYEPILTVASSHDTTVPFESVISPTVVVCANTLRLALNGATYAYKIKHTTNAARRIAQAREALKLTFKYYEGFEAEVRALLDQAVVNKEFEAILGELFPEGKTELEGTFSANKREAVREMYSQDPAAAPHKGTGWGVIQAVNTWELWSAPIRLSKGGPQDRDIARSEKQAMGLFRGTDNPVTTKAHKLLVAARN